MKLEGSNSKLCPMGRGASPLGMAGYVGRLLAQDAILGF